jgi:glycosyltransferase involved in cell wall biosynthesis
VRQLEAELVQQSQAVTVVSAVEAAVLREFCPHAAVHVISNGVDLEYFGQPTDDVACGNDAMSTPACPQCVFVGALDYLPNVDGILWFAREVWPGVHARIPRAKLVLVGHKPVAAVRQLLSQPGIEVIGGVPDVRPYLSRSRIVVVPLRIARGVQNKVLEAMAAGKPVIASPQALEGLLVAPVKHIYRAATPAQWISHICSLLADDTERQRLAAAGLSFVRRHHRWESCLQPLLERLEISGKDDVSRAALPQQHTLSSVGSEP